MNLKALMKIFRALARDKLEDFLTVDEDLKDWLNEAEEEACIRAKLIREEAMPAICRIPVTVGTFVYKLHPSVYEIAGIWLRPGNGMPDRPLQIVSRDWLDQRDTFWRDWGGSLNVPVDFVMQDDTTIRLAGYVEVDDQLVLECYRMPLDPMVRDNDEPEISSAHHRKLVQWALHRAFGVPDSDLFDPDRSDKAEREFTKHFGPRPRADMHRRIRADVPHHTTQSIV